MKLRSILSYALAILIVAILGALAGWYFFLRGASEATTAADAARGFSTQAPFGAQTGSTYQNMLSGAFGADTAGEGRAPLSQLWHADKTPVAGFSFSQAASSSELLFVERGNGYVFSADLTTQRIARITNTLLPKVYEAIFAGERGVIERSLDGSGAIVTFSGVIATSSEQGLGTTTPARALTGTYLDANIRALTAHPQTGELFALEGSLPAITGYRMLSDGTKQRSVFTSVVPGWRPMWLSDGRIILLTAPADGMPGFAYTLQDNGSLQSLVGNLPGLTALPQANSSAILYGISTGAGLSLYAQASTDASPVLLPIRTIADKCAWAPGRGLVAYCAVPQNTPTGDFLDGWYKGLVHTADAFWRVDASSGKAELIYAPDASLALDAELLAVDQSGSYLAFRDATDGSLWVLRFMK